MCSSCHQCDLHIRDLGTCQHTSVAFFFQMCQHQTLPVSFQDILTAGCLELQAAAPLSRLHEKMHLRIVAERFKMPYPFHRLCDGFFVHDTSRSKFHFRAKSFPDQPFQNFYLHLSHNLCMDFIGLLFPDNVQFRFFLLQLAELQIHLVHITFRRKLDLIGENRLKKRQLRLSLSAQPLSAVCPGQPCHRAHCPCRCLAHSTETGSGIDTELVRFFLPDLITIRLFITAVCQHSFHLQSSARDFHISQTGPLGVPGYFVYPGAEILRVFRTGRIGFQTLQKLLHSFYFQGRAEIAGKYFPLRYQPDDFSLLHSAVRQIFFQYSLITHSQILIKGLLFLLKGYTPFIQAFLQFFQQLLPVSSLLVHFINKQEHRNLVSGQKPPQCLHMSLYAISAADDQDRVIQYLQGPFHLRRKVHMPRSIQKCHFLFSQFYLSLFGKDCDSPLPFQVIGVQKCILMVHTPWFSDTARQIQDTLSQCCLAGIHMGQQTHTHMF